MSIQIQIGADISGVDKAIKSVSSELNSLKAPVVNAQNQLTSLSGVVRDLPFGFVAIQNNLPLVVDSFGQLTKQAGGLGPALKSLGSALVGPAGISFAFGAVVAGVTALIQKYGSLGEAFNQIVGSASKLTEQQKEFNKATAEAAGNVATEEAKVKILVGTINDLDAPQQKRLAAYNELKKISPDVVAGIRDENALNKTSIELINANADARLKLIQLKIQEAGITAVLTKSAEDLANANADVARLTNEVAIADAKNREGKKQTNALALQAQQGISAESITLKTLQKELQAAKLRVDEINKSQQVYYDQLKPLVSGISEINKATGDRIQKIKDEDAALKLQEKTSKKLIADAIKRQKEFSKALEDENKDLKRGEFAFYDLLELRDKFASSTDLGKKLAQSTKVFQKFRKDNLEVETNLKGPTFIPSQEFLNLQKRLLDIQNTFSVVKGNLENVFFNPLTDLFSNFFETGKFAFADFGKTILKTIGQIVSKIIATGIINLLASILVPGAGLAGVGAAKGIGGAFKAAFGSVLGFGGGNIAAPSFAGVGGGPMGMSGQVNVVLRGQDLVGAINRTNSTINRVG